MEVTALHYGQFLINSHFNFTGTYFAETMEALEHDSVYRYLKAERLTPRLVWEKARQVATFCPEGYLIFDDTVLDKRYSRAIGAARRQWSGNAHDVITGIGVVNCVYYHPALNHFWVLDYRIFDPDTDGKTKLDHVADMLKSALRRPVLFRTVLMDTWYATTAMMRRIHDLKRVFFCPIKANRLVDDTGGAAPYRPVAQLTWSETDLARGKLVKIKKFPGASQHRLFRVPVSTDRTDYVVTNDVARDSAEDAQNASCRRWTIEQLHREEKQLTGIDRCQTRLNRSQRNHICLATAAWLVLKEAAQRRGVSIYEQKKRPLLTFMVEQWRNPATVFAL